MLSFKLLQISTLPKVLRQPLIDVSFTDLCFPESTTGSSKSPLTNWYSVFEQSVWQRRLLSNHSKCSIVLYCGYVKMHGIIVVMMHLLYLCIGC
jgi:hypothetical protein